MFRATKARFDSIDTQLKALKELILSTANQSGVNLQKATAAVISSVGQAMGAVKGEIQDFEDQLAASLKAAGVPQTTVDSVTGQLTSLKTTVDSIAAAAQAADPGEPIVIQTLSLPSGQEGVVYSFSLQATGGKGILLFSESGLPAGLVMTPTGIITGTPAAGDAGTVQVIITATDTANNSAVQPYSLTIAAAAPPVPVPAPTPAGTGTSAPSSSGSTGSPAPAGSTT